MRFIGVVGPWVAGSSGGMAGLGMAEKVTSHKSY